MDSFYSVDVDSEEIGNIPHISLIIKGIMVCSLHCNQELSDGLGGQFAGLALSKGKHCTLYEVKLLLEVIEANASINFVPVENLGLIRHFDAWPITNALEAAVDIFIIENIE